eukprot:9584270-Prorocentrum_lima.AAC.1
MPAVIQGGLGDHTDGGLDREGQGTAPDDRHPTLPPPSGAGCDLGIGRPPPPVSSPAPLHSVMIE